MTNVTSLTHHTRALLLAGVVIALGALASHASEAATSHCPDHNGHPGKVEGGALDGLVLDAGTVFCVKAGPEAGGTQTADGVTPLSGYVTWTVGQGNTPGVSYYVVYSVPDNGNGGGNGNGTDPGNGGGGVGNGGNGNGTTPPPGTGVPTPPDAPAPDDNPGLTCEELTGEHLRIAQTLGHCITPPPIADEPVAEPVVEPSIEPVVLSLEWCDADGNVRAETYQDGVLVASTVTASDECAIATPPTAPEEVLPEAAPAPERPEAPRPADTGHGYTPDEQAAQQRYAIGLGALSLALIAFSRFIAWKRGA